MSEDVYTELKDVEPILRQLQDEGVLADVSRPGEEAKWVMTRKGHELHDAWKPPRRRRRADWARSADS